MAVIGEEEVTREIDLALASDSVHQVQEWAHLAVDCTSIIRVGPYVYVLHAIKQTIGNERSPNGSDEAQVVATRIIRYESSIGCLSVQK